MPLIQWVIYLIYKTKVFNIEIKIRWVSLLNFFFRKVVKSIRKRSPIKVLWFGFSPQLSLFALLLKPLWIRQAWLVNLSTTPTDLISERTVKYSL